MMWQWMDSDQGVRVWYSVWMLSLSAAGLVLVWWGNKRETERRK